MKILNFQRFTLKKMCCTKQKKKKTFRNVSVKNKHPKPLLVRKRETEGGCGCAHLYHHPLVKKKKLIREVHLHWGAYASVLNYPPKYTVLKMLSFG